MPAMRQRKIIARIEVDAGFSELTDGELVDNMAEAIGEMGVNTDPRRAATPLVTWITVEYK